MEIVHHNIPHAQPQQPSPYIHNTHTMRTFLLIAGVALASAAPAGKCDVCHLHYYHKVRERRRNISSIKTLRFFYGCLFAMGLSAHAVSRAWLRADASAAARSRRA